MAKSAFLDAHPQRTAPASCSAEEGLVQEDKDATLAMDLQEQEMKLARMGVKGEKTRTGYSSFNKAGGLLPQDSQVSSLTLSRPHPSSYVPPPSGEGYVLTGEEVGTEMTKLPSTPTSIPSIPNPPSADTLLEDAALQACGYTTGDTEYNDHLLAVRLHEIEVRRARMERGLKMRGRGGKKMSSIRR